MAGTAQVVLRCAPTFLNLWLASFRRAYSIYEDANVYSAEAAGRLQINGYDDKGFIINGVRHESSLLCLGKLAFLWKPKTLAEISPDSLSLFQLLRPAPEILLIGCGKHIKQISPEVRSFLKANGIKVEAIDTVNAASTFNFLNEEGRQVALAMLPAGVK